LTASGGFGAAGTFVHAMMALGIMPLLPREVAQDPPRPHTHTDNEQAYILEVLLERRLNYIVVKLTEKTPARANHHNSWQWHVARQKTGWPQQLQLN
jgi:hypothetical protein